MKEYLLKQPKATCVLFSIDCKINLGLVKNNGNPGGRGVFGLGNPVGRGRHSDPGNPGGRGGQKTLLSLGGGGGWGVDFFWNNPMVTSTNLCMNMSLIEVNTIYCSQAELETCNNLQLCMAGALTWVAVYL